MSDCKHIWSEPNEFWCMLCGVHKQDYLQSELAKLQEERKEIFWIMFQASQRKLPVQFRERRWKPEAKWADCASDPVWNWSDYEYRIKAKEKS